MVRSILRLKKSKIKIVLITLLLISSSFFSFWALFNYKYQDRIFPNIYVAGINVGGLDQKGAENLLSGMAANSQGFLISEPGQTVSIKPDEIDLKYNFPSSLSEAFNVGRSGNFLKDHYARALLFFYPVHINSAVSLNNEKLEKYISILAGQVSQDPIYPTIKVTSGKIVIERGAPGIEVDRAALKKTVTENLENLKYGPIDMPINKVDPTLSNEEEDRLKNTAESYLGKKIQINFEFQTFTLADTDIIKVLNVKGGWDDAKLTKSIETISAKVDRAPQNPKFNFDSGRVTEFMPATDGVLTKKDEFKTNLTARLLELKNSSDKVITLDVPVERTPPEVSTGAVNDLGIKELIGRGTSTFYHSIPSRVHNVVLASSKINGTLVKPGETFSFNQTLGDVSQFTGYQQAYIIQDGKTILGDGGGVCQVSTTLFRSLLNAGLPITERAAHAYRVGYYEQNSPPGLDATVYGPSPDLKFTNNTPAYVLIEAKADPKNYSLVFELYGTSDGRTAAISKPVVSGVTPPPEDLYQDDPTLPVGTIKQIDYKAWGAKVTFNYTVTRAGEQIYKKTFVSNYRPWQAIYLRGTKI